MDDPRHARPAQPSAVAATLDDASIHLWWLPRQRNEGRAPLLRVLSGYLGMRHEVIHLGENPHGRPQLDGELAGQLDFNWSHSGERAVIAVARHLPTLGVDVEHVRPRHSFMALAERFYAPAEYALLEALPPESRHAAFIRLWTAKEATLKAHGRGLAYGLDKVTLTLEDDSLRLVRLEGELGDAASWHLEHWPLPDQGFATLCWQHGQRQVQHFTLPDNFLQNPL